MNITPPKTGPPSGLGAQAGQNHSKPAPVACMFDWELIYLGLADRESKTWHVLRPRQRRRKSTIVDTNAAAEGAIRKMEEFDVDDSS